MPMYLGVVTERLRGVSGVWLEACYAVLEASWVSFGGLLGCLGSVVESFSNIFEAS